MIKKITTFFKRKIAPYLIAYGAKFTIRLILFTCRVRIQGVDRFIATAKTSPSILMLWHNRLVLIAEILHNYTPKFIYTAFISKSRDGAPLALLAESYKNGRALRVPHNSRHHALGQMIQQLKERQSIMLITPDGPRGPRYTMKPGISTAARAANAAIIPFSWSATRYWQLNTWDQMRIPKPFTTITATFGAPIVLENEDTEADLELLTRALND